MNGNTMPYWVFEQTAKGNLSEVMVISAKGWWFIGLALSVGWIAANLLSFLFAWLWQWLDDAEQVNRKLYLAHLWYGRYRGWELWYNGEYKKPNGTLVTTPHLDVFVVGVSIFFFMPVTLRYQWDIVLILGTIIAIMHTARFGRRTSKLFNKHVKDKGAHK